MKDNFQVGKLYNMFLDSNDSLQEKYNIVKKNTYYLNDIDIKNIKEISISIDDDIIVLFKDGQLYINGNMYLENINILAFMAGYSIFAISNDKVITCITNSLKTSEFINNNDYKYKKVVVTPLEIVALTYNNDIKFMGSVVDEIIDYHLFYDVDDIGYYEEEKEIIVIKKDKARSLFSNKTYGLKTTNIKLEGKDEDYIII